MAQRAKQADLSIKVILHLALSFTLLLGCERGQTETMDGETGGADVVGVGGGKLLPKATNRDVMTCVCMELIPARMRAEYPRLANVAKPRQERCSFLPSQTGSALKSLSVVVLKNQSDSQFANQKNSLRMRFPRIENQIDIDLAPEVQLSYLVAGASASQVVKGGHLFYASKGIVVEFVETIDSQDVPLLIPQPQYIASLAASAPIACK